ncbi:MAG: hypothetical protein LBE99_01955 [Puniceicoccales bacterium]|jgi:hypothetical protein|nr:hypothetical protein [Puniceicoccales bacterium]
MTFISAAFQKISIATVREWISSLSKYTFESFHLQHHDFVLDALSIRFTLELHWISLPWQVETQQSLFEQSPATLPKIQN